MRARRTLSGGFRRKLVALAVALAASAGAGCATIGLPRLLQPDVQVRTIRLDGLTINGGSLDVVLGVYNPNHINLDASRVTYQLFVDSIPFGNGAVDTRTTLNAGDTTVVTLPLDFTWTGVGTAGREILNTGTLPYRLTGDLTVGSGIGNFTFRYDRSGRVNALGGGAR